MSLRLLLDSTVLIDALRSRGVRRTVLSEFVQRGHTLCVAAVSVGEVYAGMRPGEEAAVSAIFEGLHFYPATEAIAQRAGLLKNTFARKGLTLSLLDMLIAATALEHDLTLLTDNIKDFPIPELKLHT